PSVDVKRQRSMKFSLYPAQPRTTPRSPTPSGPTSPVFPTSPQLPPSPLPSREDSLPSHHRPYTSHHEGPRSFTTPPQLSQSLHKKLSEASRLRALNNGYKSNSSDGPHTQERHTPDPLIENFSRPRQPSLRRRNESPNTTIHSPAGFPLSAHDEEQTPTDLASSRDRGFSTSSSHSVAHTPAYPLRPSTSIPDYQTADSIHSRQRNLNNSAYKPSRGLSRPDSNYSAHRREPITRPTGLESEEIRASFRSALTTNSSFMGTSGTERSSVMTKSSSATSIFGRDEGMSVDDAIGMYESGFGDSGVEDNYGGRPMTASSEQKRISGLEEAMNDTLEVPNTGHAIIRDSTTIFTPGGLDTPSPRHSAMDGSMDVQESYFGSKPASRPVTSTPPTKFDETRDRYGFKKKNQHISVAQYDAWNGPYTEYLARRRKKWLAMMKDNGLPAEKPERFPPKSRKVKHFVRKGIPPDWRGAAWFYYAGGPEMIAKHPGVYEDLVRKAAAGSVSETDDEIIERDLNRTFPDNIKFKPDPPPGDARNSQRTIVDPETPILQSLRRVLQAFSIYNPQIGYCQSLNFLAGLLLLFMDEEKSFWMLNIITRVYLPGTHELNLEGANVDLGVLMNSIKEMMPSIWAKIGGELDGSAFTSHSMRLPPITLCTTAWFMSCFIGTLPIETTLRVWDVFFLEGSRTLFRIALTIFKVGEAEIKAVNDPMEIFQVVQTIPRRLIDANALMEACTKRRNGFGHLSQEAIEKGRAERRRGYAEER
ncbi:RabGAP/TBC, partial [Hyaloscypha bicolor E]